MKAVKYDMLEIAENPELLSLMLGMIAGHLAKVGEPEASQALMRVWYSHIGPCKWIQNQGKGTHESRRQKQ